MTTVIDNDVSAFSEPETIEKARLQIEEAIRALKTRRNALSLSSRLPPELLAKIFLFTSFHDNVPGQCFSLDWIRVSHVCRLWRDIALDCSSLWVNLPMWDINWTQEMLIRSKTSALSMNVQMTGRYLESIRANISSVLKQHSRIGAMHIVILYPQDYKQISKSLQSGLPKLESLLYRSEVDPSKAPQHNLLAPLLADTMPQLRRLHLRGIGLEGAKWPSLQLSRLAHLAIHSLYQRPTMHGLLALLKSMPYLLSLSLIDALPIARPDDSAPSVVGARQISLSSLELLHLGRNPLECANFIKNLSIPPHAAVKLICGYSWISTPLEYISQMLLEVAPHVNALLDSGSVQNLCVGYDSWTGIHLEGWTMSGDDGDPPLFSPVDITMFSAVSEQRTQMLTSLCQFFHLSVVKNVHFHPGDRDVCPEDGDPRVHMELLRGLAVTTLRISSKSTAFALMDELEEAEEEFGSSNLSHIGAAVRPRMLWPQLCKIEVDYRPGDRQFLDMVSGSLRDRSFPDTLRGFLARRSYWNAGVDILELRTDIACNLSELSLHVREIRLPHPFSKIHAGKQGGGGEQIKEGKESREEERDEEGDEQESDEEESDEEESDEEESEEESEEEVDYAYSEEENWLMVAISQIRDISPRNL